MEKHASHISSQAHRLIFSPYDSLDATERRVVKTMAALYVTLLRSFIVAGYVTLGCLVMLKPKMSTTVYFLWAWSLAEVTFHLFMLFRTRFVLDKILPFVRPCHEDGLALTEEICRSAPRLEEVFGSWQPAGAFDLTRFNTWLVFYWFYKLPEQLTKQEKKELTLVQKKIEEVYSIKLRHLPFVKEAGIRPLIEPVPFKCKPLLVYLVRYPVD
ncbi:hypothetical protein DSO57_1010294 [Entomophthora muscae]|uniref:Uncharacterized protein n=1 Tax=Entomophthora muscae TaxID=34485 RepID=A0ACC2T6L2_9FUNG|nr:hypothetical protein DSO57_1010294 [Entomophthora muscae]